MNGAKDTAKAPAEKSASAPSKKAAGKAKKKTIKVKNIRKSPLCTSTGTIEPGKTGTCTEAEARQYSKYIEKA